MCADVIQVFVCSSCSEIEFVEWSVAILLSVLSKSRPFCHEAGMQAPTWVPLAPDGGVSFKAMSWNILAETYCSPYAPPRTESGH